jgi:hypothetical protein
MRRILFLRLSPAPAPAPSPETTTSRRDWANASWPRAGSFSDNAWNQAVDGAPIDPRSAEIIFIGLDKALHPDFGAD